MKKRKININRTAKRYAVKLIIDIKDDLLFGDDLMNYIIASVKHDTSKMYHNEDFYYKCEDAVLDLYEKYVVKCSCCNKYIHIDCSKKPKKKKERYCLDCWDARKRERNAKYRQ